MTDATRPQDVGALIDRVDGYLVSQNIKLALLDELRSAVAALGRERDELRAIVEEDAGLICEGGAELERLERECAALRERLAGAHVSNCRCGQAEGTRYDHTTGCLVDPRCAALRAEGTKP